MYHLPPPQHTDGKIAQTSRAEATNQTAQQKRFPDSGEAVAQPREAQFEIDRLNRCVHDESAHLVSNEEHWGYGERVGNKNKGNGQWQITTQPKRHGRGEQ